MYVVGTRLVAGRGTERPFFFFSCFCQQIARCHGFTLGWFWDCFVLTFLASAHMVDATARGWGAMLMFLARAHMVDATAMLGWFLVLF